MENGRIILGRDVHLLSRGSGDVIVGPSHETVSLGLDAGGNGKFRESGSVAGLVFLFLPMAVSDTKDVKFQRVADKPQGYKACDNR